MNRLFFPAVFVSWLWLVSGVTLPAANTQSRYVAFSLKEAEQALKKPANQAAARKFAGITRPIAVVVDEAAGDLVIVGEVKNAAAPVSLDDWVVALRASIKEGHVPLVSIDLTPETETTHMQMVHFEGGIANTRVGRDMLDADVALKKMGLSLLGTPQGVQSYTTIAGDRWRRDGQEKPVSSRFWFVPSDQSVVMNDPGIALLETMEVRVRTEFMTTDQGAAPEGAKDDAGEQFAASMTDHIAEAGSKIAAISRLDPIFRLSGLAQAVAKWRKTAPATVPDLSYWLDTYQIPATPTPEQFDLLSSNALHREGGDVQFSVSGGIDTTMLLAEWKAESKVALKALVLLSRPAVDALTWSVPLDDQPNAKLLSALAKSPVSKTMRGEVWYKEGTTLSTKFERPNGQVSKPVFQDITRQPRSTTTNLLREPPANTTLLPQESRSFSLTSDGPNAVQDARIAANLLGSQARVVLHGLSSSPAARALRTLLPNSVAMPAHVSPFEQGSLDHNSANVTFHTAVVSPNSTANAVSMGFREYSHTTIQASVRDRDQSSSMQQLPRVGGVMLRGAAEASDEDSQVTAGDFSLIFDGTKNEIDVCSLRRFVTALWATYFTEEGPGISIDPIGDGKEIHAVRYIGNVINSDLGRVMREADYLMKSWAVGVARPKVPKWMTPEDYAKKQGVIHLDGSRFWFVPEDMVFSRSGDESGIVFRSGKMVVKTEYLMDQEERDAIAKAKAAGKKPEHAMASSENEAWAAAFTARYDELSRQAPVLDELYEYARQVSLAKYLKSKRISLLWYMLANREMVITEDSPGTVEAFAKKSKLVENIKIYGGVDLAASLSGGKFVIDAKFAAALNAARANAPEASSKGSGDQPTISVVQEDKQNLTVAPSTSVVICDSADGGQFATDLGLRTGKDPDLELARFHRQELPQVQTFGRDWHILIPYSIHPASAKRIPFANAEIPETMVLRNLLSGREEILHFDDTRYKIAGYVPDDAATNINIGLFLLTDHSYRLADKLGCEFEFDKAGRLTEMTLAPSYHVSYHYGEKKLGWRDFEERGFNQPYRLAPEGTETVDAGNVLVPRRLRLFDAATGEEEVFVFAPNNSDHAVGYTPEKGEHSSYRFLALLSQGSLLLKHRSGAEIEFDRSGAFRHQLLMTLESIQQNTHKVDFKYEIVANQYRIVSAAVSDMATGHLQHTVNYTYGEDGHLEDSSVVSIPTSEKPAAGEKKREKSAALSNPAATFPVALQ